VGTSIISGLGKYYAEVYSGHLDQNPHVRFFDERNGRFMRCDITQEEWRVEMMLADSIANSDSTVRTFASFVVEDGKPGAQRASGSDDEHFKAGPRRPVVPVYRA
jgi:alkaline phosphatase D